MQSERTELLLTNLASQGRGGFNSSENRENSKLVISVYDTNTFWRHETGPLKGQLVFIEFISIVNIVILSAMYLVHLLVFIVLAGKWSNTTFLDLVTMSSDWRVLGDTCPTVTVGRLR